MADKQETQRQWEYLIEIRGHFADYHHHKETAAWASLVVALGVAGLAVQGKEWGTASVQVKVIVTVFVGLVAIAALAVMRSQFRLKHFAAKLVWASWRLQLEVMSGRVLTGKELQLQEAPPQGRLDAAHLRDYIPGVLVEMANRSPGPPARYLGTAKRLEVLALSLVVVAMIASVLIVWWT